MAAAVLRNPAGMSGLSSKSGNLAQGVVARVLSIVLAGLIAIALFALMERLIRIEEITLSESSTSIITDFIAKDPEPFSPTADPIEPVKPDIVAPPPTTSVAPPDMEGVGLPAFEIPKPAPAPGPKIEIAPTSVNVPRQPVAIRPPMAVYPKRAASADLSGTCDVGFSLDHTGAPFGVSAVCSDPVFVSAAERAVRKARFAAATNESGRPIAAHNMVYPLVFQMED